jgi:hypothetical protein
MDYLLLSSVVGTTIKSITISYDIACQWGKHFATRANNPTLPNSLHLSSSISLQFIVPKFHLPAHIPKCHGPFSFNYASGVGRTDGEGVERNWSVLNGTAPSVSMMGPGGRWDTLDDICNYVNWRKTISLCDFVIEAGGSIHPSSKTVACDPRSNYPPSSIYCVY